MGRPEEIALGAQAFIRAVSDFIFVEDAPAPSDVIFVPGSAYPEHALRAAELYGQGMAEWVLPSGRYSLKADGFPGVPEAWRTRYPGHYETEWDYLRDVLTGADVPEQAILREDQARYTWGQRPALPGGDGRDGPDRASGAAVRQALPRAAGAAVLSGGVSGGAHFGLSGGYAGAKSGRLVSVGGRPGKGAGRGAPPGRADQRGVRADAARGRNRQFVTILLFCQRKTMFVRLIKAGNRHDHA